MLVDLALVVLLALAALGGRRRGLITSVLSAGGWLAGMLVGLVAVPALLDRTETLPAEGYRAALVTVLGALVLAALGAALMGYLGRLVVRATDVRPVRVLDSALGMVAMTLMTALAAWALLSSARPLLPEELAESVDRSHGMAALDRAVPSPVRAAVGDLTDRLQNTPFPEVFADAPGADTPVAAPDPQVAQAPAITAARSSILKIRSSSPQCSAISVGTGWAVAPDRVVTNAHVVAGGQRITAQTGGTGLRHGASVLAFDPELDLAILDVPGLDARPLQRAGDLHRGTDAVAVGFPQGGDYTLTAARVSGVLRAAGRDVYDRTGVVREVYALHGTLLPGDSGGPLLTTDGTVAGTVFARSATSSTVGYALTDDATDAWLDRAAGLSQEVGTGSCLPQRPAA